MALTHSALILAYVWVLELMSQLCLSKDLCKLHVVLPLKLSHDFTILLVLNYEPEAPQIIPGSI